jgi:phospholipid/cholesterol/gamma-HCH transport system substrate-binding protein
VEVSRSTEIKVGLVSIVGIALLIGGIMLGKGISFSVTTQVVKIRMANSGGVEKGSPVVIDGVRRGQVLNVHTDSGSVLVDAELDEIGDLHPDASALVTMLEITGGKKVEISSGKEPGVFDVRKEMPGKAAADIPQLVTMLGEVSGPAMSLILRLDSITASINELLSDGKVIADLRLMTSDGAILIGDLRGIVHNNRGNIEAAIRDTRSLIIEIRTAVANNEPKLSSLLDSLASTVGRVDGTLGKADGAIVRADTLIRRLNDVVAEIQNGKGTIHGLIYDEAFFRRLDSTMMGLKTFIKNVDRKGVNVNVGIGWRE